MEVDQERGWRDAQRQADGEELPETEISPPSRFEVRDRRPADQPVGVVGEALRAPAVASPVLRDALPDPIDRQLCHGITMRFRDRGVEHGIAA